MKNRFELTDFVSIKTPDSTISELVYRFKARRKEMKLSREALAKESKVSFASIRRFEETGEISLTSLVKLSNAMGMLDDFDKLFVTPKVKSIKDL